MLYIVRILMLWLYFIPICVLDYVCAGFMVQGAQKDGEMKWCRGVWGWLSQFLIIHELLILKSFLPVTPKWKENSGPWL